MKAYWLNQQGNENLIVFFSGWSFDENPFKKFDCGDYDILMVYDYNDLNEPLQLNELGGYKSKTLISWSMGVFVAYLLRNLFFDFDYKIAINGTVTPVDNDFGIPVKMFELTLKHASTGLGGKFYKNVFNTEEDFCKYNQSPVERSVEDRVSELENLYDLIKSSQIQYSKFYDVALVGEFDKIIPPKNQIASHNANSVPTISLSCGHFPYYQFKSWGEVIIKCRQIVNI